MTGVDVTTQPVTRRSFIQLLLGFSILSTIGGMLTPVIGYLLPPKQDGASYGDLSDVGQVSQFGVNTGSVVAVNNKPVIVVNTKTGGLKAYSAICTHLGCIAAWDSEKRLIHCPCHEGFFNPSNGAVVSGPPPRPLAEYELSVKDEKVFIGKPLGQLYGG